MDKASEGVMPLSQEDDEWLKSSIRDIPDFPKPGIVFKDLTTLLKDAKAFSFVVNVMAENYRRLSPDYVAGVEARGFILGPPIAAALGAGFIPVRKPGKLPHKVESVEYELEYGTDTLEVHEDAIEPGKSVIIVDDLLATGGTAKAAYELLSRLDAEITGIGFMVELAFLSGRKKLPSDVDIFSVLTFE